VLARALFLSGLLLVSVAPAQDRSPGELETRNGEFARELRVREAAADPGSAAPWFAQALEGSTEKLPWTATADALDALARALDARPELELSRWRKPLERWSASEHPNLRAWSWRVLSRLDQGSRFTPPKSGAAAITTWEERMERARFLARAGVDEAALEALCADPDPRVAELALAEWLLSPARTDERAAAAWLRAFEAARAREDGGAIELLERLELAPQAATIAALVSAVHERGSFDAAPAVHALGLAVLARQGARLAPQQLDALAAHWDSAVRWQPRSRALLTRAARDLGEAIGMRLVDAGLARAGSPEVALNCFAGAVEALEPNRMLRAAGALAHGDPQLASALWDSLRGRVEAWEPDALSVWLAPGVPAEQRARCVLVVAETFRQNRDPGSARILLAALEDRDSSVAAEAFQGLAQAPDPGPWMEALQRAWSRRSSAWRMRRLGDLSRELAWRPFRADLLELASLSRASSATVAELLAPFHGDAEVIDALRAWFDQDLAALRESPRGTPESALDPRALSSALVLARALTLAAGEAALPALLDGLEISRERSIELGKACILHLGRMPAGRARLQPWLGSELPSRLRAEAALALAAHPGREPALRALLEGYANFDEDLRSRALRAFALGDDPDTARRLLDVARARDSGPAEMLTAVECLGERARRAPELADALFAWLEEDGLDPDLRTLTLEVLARHGAAGAHTRLVERLRRVEAMPPLADPASRAADERALEREILISVLAAADAVDALDARTAFALPLQSAAAEFHARCAGRRRAEVGFTWRSELELLAAFARAGRMRRALDEVEGWRGLDARFLLEASERVEPPPRAAAALASEAAEASERLVLAAIIGLGGEAAIDDSARVRFEARRRALEAAAVRGDHAAFAARGARLLHDVRSGAVSEWNFARGFGEHDPARGVDGLAQLECEVHAARARVALAAGRAEEARRELQAARDSRGASRAAHAAVERLEREF